MIAQTAPWAPHSGGASDHPLTHARAAFELGADDGWWGRPQVPPAAWPELADDYRSGHIAGAVAREQGRGTYA